MPIKKITLISTSLNTGSLIYQLFVKAFPEIIIRNIVDDSLVKEAIAHGDALSPSVVKRVCDYVLSAEMSGADLAVITCSTISKIAKVAENMVNIPVMRIDEPMAEIAVKEGRRIKVLATISSTLTPSLELIRNKALEKGKEIDLDSSLCERARTSLDEGNPEAHDRILREEIEKFLKDFDFVILSQASMGRVLDTLEAEKRKRVLASPSLAVDHIRGRFFSE